MEPPSIFKKCLKERPTLKIRKNAAWHIGNLEFYNDLGCFAFGKTSKTTREKFNEMTHNFIEVVDDQSPYTLVFFDLSIGLLGIGKKVKLAPTVKAIARKIKNILESCEIITNSGIEVRVDPIPDPDTFLTKIKSAYAIKSFKAAFTGPNPIDADELFQRPLSVYCKEIGGEKGMVQVRGNNLDENVVAEVAKSSAATGNTASARIQDKKGKRSYNVSLSGDAVKTTINDGDSKELTSYHIRKVYDGVRHHESN